MSRKASNFSSPQALTEPPEDVHTYLQAQEHKSFLRFLTCGSVDDGKSTLIGRLLYESQLLFDDQLAMLAHDSQKMGTQGDELDFALLVDGLAAEREQGITIDVAYRFFATEKRKFIVADTPGHEQYTRNMATGASTADLAILLIDARKGVRTQTCRHAFITALLGIRHFVLAINKMDLVAYDEAKFYKSVADFEKFAKQLPQNKTLTITPIPISALKGDNITRKSDATGWYQGETLIEHLENIDLEATTEHTARLPVQWVNRPHAHFRGFSGQLASGQFSVGDLVQILPSKTTSNIREIITPGGKTQIALEGQSITLVLEDEVDASRGDVICTATKPAQISDQFEAHILWMAEDPMLPGRPYILKCNSQTTLARINRPKHKVNVNTLEELAAPSLALNDIGLVSMSLERPLVFEPYTENRTMGGFILIDRLNNNTVGMGMLKFALRRAANVHWQEISINKEAHARQKHQKPAVLWFTGLSGAGKSTIADVLQQMLYARGHHSYLLDGDNVRHGLNRDLGFTDADRVENIRRVAEVAHLMSDAGLMTLVSFISPFRAERQMAREMMDKNEFIEIHVATTLAIAEARDPKGLYKKARAGKIKHFTGLDSPYEPPENPELVINTENTTPEQAAQYIMTFLETQKFV